MIASLLWEWGEECVFDALKEFGKWKKLWLRLLRNGYTVESGLCMAAVEVCVYGVVGDAGCLEGLHELGVFLDVALESMDACDDLAKLFLEWTDQ